MSAINLRLLQDSEIENFGSPKPVSDLMEEVRGLFDNYIPIKITNNNGSPNKLTIGLNSSPVGNKTSTNQNGIESPKLLNNRSPLSPPSISNKLQTTTTTTTSTNSNILKPSDRLFKLNNNNNNNNNNQSQQQIQQINNNLNVINNSNNNNNNKLKNPIESSFIDVKKIGLKELSLLLTKRREGSVHVQAIKQIANLYQQACNTNLQKQQFLDEINKGTCLRSLLSYLTISEPKFDSFEFNSQLEAIKIISILTGNDSIKTFIKQTGDIPTIVQVLNWSHKLENYNTFNLNLINLISNLATQESCASILRKAGAIGPIFSISTNSLVSNDLRIIALNTLIIFSSYSDPKISEAIVDSKTSLELIFTNIVNNSVTNTSASKSASSASSNQLSIKFLDLLYQVSDCAKTRAIAFECGIEKLVTLIRPDLIYPIELNRINYFRNDGSNNVGNNNYNSAILESTLVQTNLQSKLLQCLEKLSKHESNRNKIGLHATDSIILAYSSPMFKIPREVFKWNTIMLERTLKFAIQILQDDTCKQLFVERDGCKNMVWMIQQSDLFSSSVLLSCAQVLGIVATPKKASSSNSIQISIDKIIESDVIPSLMKLYKSYPDEKILQLLMCNVFKHLGTIDDNKQIIFSEGGFQLLHNLLNSQDLDLTSHSLDALCVLSTNNFIRKVLRILGSISLIIERLSLPNSAIQKSSITNLYNISQDSEGIEILTSGLSPATLNSLLFGNESDIQIQVVLMIENFIHFDENYLETFIDGGGIASLMNSLYSNNEKLQFQVLNLLNRIIQNSKAQSIILNSGIVNKLKSLSTHENVVKSNSTLIEPMRTFIIAVKSIPQPEVDVKPVGIQQQQQPNKILPSIKKESSSNILIGNRVAAIAANEVQSQQPQRVSPTIKAQTLPDFNKIGVVLSRLNEEQLRDVVIELIKQNTLLADLLPITIRGVITGNKLPFPTVPTAPPQQQQRVNVSSMLSPSLFLSGSIPPPPPPLPPQSSPLSTNSPNSPLHQIGNVKLRPTVHTPKKESVSSGGMNGISSSDILNSPVFQKRENNPSPMPEFANNKRNYVNSNNSSFSNLMNELQNKVKNGAVKLQHIDTEKQIEDRRKERLMKQNVGILKDIISGANKRNNNNSTTQKKRLIDSSMIQGMRVWKKSFDLYKQEIKTIFKRYDVFSILVFKILDSIEDFSFQEALEISGFSDSELLAQQLLRIGFNLKCSTFVINNSSDPDGTPITEYNSIIKPTGIPIKLILCILVEQICSHQ